MNYILLTFSFFTSSVIIGGSLINTLESKLPAFLIKTFRYGKFSFKGRTSKITSKVIVEVPKSWFKHYYACALCIYAYAFCMVTSVYVFNYDVPKWFTFVLNETCDRNRVASTSATKTYIAFFLLTLQVLRRFYDTHYVSVFGKHGKMTLAHYLIGLFHYPGCALAILCEAPKFANKALPLIAETFNAANVSKVDVALVGLFLWAWWHQHVTTKILADLRKDGKGTVVSDKHKIPYGDWFEYLTAPHQTAEIVMYIVLTILLWTNFTWFFVFTWVISNQIETILLTHWWYREKFHDFPKHRKALIPFVY